MLKIFETLKRKRRLVQRKKRKISAKPKSTNQEWLTPKVYKGKSMHELELEEEAQ